MDSKNIFKDMFYCCENFLQKQAVRLEMDEAREEMASYIWNNRSKILKELEILSEPLRLVVHKGTYMCDCLCGGPLKLISNLLLENLKQSEISGWSTTPVILKGKSGQKISGYAALTVAGKCGDIDERRSSCRILPPIPSLGVPERKEWVGWFFDENTWDGSDIFTPGDAAHIFMTRRAKDLFERFKTKNLEFIPLNEVKYTPLWKIREMSE